MIPFLKKNKDGKKPPKSTVPRTAQESIPFQRMFEDGTCRVRPGYYTRTIQYQDINYALKKEMIRVIQGISGLDREMIQQMVNENKEALLIAQTNLADSEKKLKEIEEQNQKAERNCSDLFTWASTYKGASFERRQAILKQFIKEVRVGRDYNIEIVLNVPLDEFEEFKRHAASAGRGKNQKNKSQNPQKVGRCTSNAGIVVLDKTAGETISIVPKNAAHAILRC